MVDEPEHVKHGSGVRDRVELTVGLQNNECLIVSLAGWTVGDNLGELTTWKATPLRLTSPLALEMLWLLFLLKLVLRGNAGGAEEEGAGNRERAGAMVPDRMDESEQNLRNEMKQTKHLFGKERVYAYQDQQCCRNVRLPHICGDPYHALVSIERSLFNRLHEFDSGSQTKGCFAL